MEESHLHLVRLLAPYGVESFRIANILHGITGRTRHFDTRLIGRVVQEARAGLVTSGTCACRHTVMIVAR
jgi:hypothetical protein